MPAYPENFTVANKFTQKWEKGFVNHPNDPGGITYNGVSLMFLKDAGIDINGDGRINAEDIKTLYRNGDQAKVDALFYDEFWRKPNLDQFKYLPLQTVLYDTGVNIGPTQTARLLQRACNALIYEKSLKLAEDGVIGLKTIGHALLLSHEDGGKKLALTFLEKRMAFHNGLVSNPPKGKNFRPFAAGWRNRVNDLVKYVKGL